MNSLRCFLVACLGLTFAAGCNGALELEFGETLCDDEISCQDGFRCIDGVCVIDTTGNVLPPDEEALPDWPGADEEQPDALPRCRGDEQCSSGERCFNGQCVADTCNDFVCPAGTVCRPRCRPKEDACDGVTCVDNATTCNGGSCVPLCSDDPCKFEGCLEGTEGCVDIADPVDGGPLRECTTVAGIVCDEEGNCVDAQVPAFCQNGGCSPCSDGSCSEADIADRSSTYPESFTDVDLAARTPACDDRACDDGFECVVDCLPADPCQPNPCNDGFRCEDLGEAGFRCIPLLCSGVSCPAGEICVSGNCFDPCAELDCSAGGKSGCGENQTCCNRECCPDFFSCREGSCIPPDLSCDPQCEDDEFCTEAGCFCGEAVVIDGESQLEQCMEDQCCLDPNPSDDNPGQRACTNPCAGENPCADPDRAGFDPLLQGCEIACDVPEGFRCTDQCEGVTCDAPDTCDPATGSCSCGGVNCEAGECCESEACVDVCAGLDCTGIGKCEPRCGSDPSAVCVDQCEDVECTRGQECNPETGQCTCGGETCGGNECCAGDSCVNPCDTADCPSGLACRVDCSQPNNFRCEDLCPDGRCEDNDRNPTCNPDNGNCTCGLDDTCGNSECCVGGDCERPCDGNPCLDLPGDDNRCVRDCSRSQGFRCEDFCAGVTCNKPGTSCDPLDGNCKCNSQIGTPGNSCTGSNRCCSGSGNTCEDPCAGNPCSGGSNQRCVRDCNESDGFRCENFCAGVTCDKPGTSCDPIDGRCKCSGDLGTPGSGSACDGSDCCSGSGNTCEDPCSGSPCGNGGRCIRDCSEGDGFRCENQCSPNDCQDNDRNPDCFPPNGQCRCGGGDTWDTCSSNECCLSDSCDDPCNPNPCSGSTSQCVRDCSRGNGFRCENPCDDITCNSPRTSCDPVDGRCECGGEPATGNNRCCVDNDWIDPCAGDPCGNSGRCIRDCTESDGFRCENRCEPNSCGDQPNPDCFPPSGECRCGGGNDWDTCSGSECCVSDACVDPCAGDPCAGNGNNTACRRDCSEPGGFECFDACANNNTCEDSPINPVCDNSTGDCFCENDGTACGNGQICCAAGGGDNECRQPQTGSCPPGQTFDACTGQCSGGGG